MEGKFVPELWDKINSIKGFYDLLRSKVEKAFLDIDTTKRVLKMEIQEIGELKVQTEETKTFVSMDDVEALRDIVTKSAHDLIEKSIQYRKRHINRPDIY